MVRSDSFRGRGIFRPEKIEALLNQHTAGQVGHGWLLWRIINIERWQQVSFDDFSSTAEHYGHTAPTAEEPAMVCT